ncbi:hypothetical protein GX48_05716 [Paracoccidioides brasiliensis]|nr:hypothetical protein GX48_05716 [Paracoccidioides brasiliensis]
MMFSQPTDGVAATLAVFGMVREPTLGPGVAGFSALIGQLFPGTSSWLDKKAPGPITGPAAEA